MSIFHRLSTCNVTGFKKDAHSSFLHFFLQQQIVREVRMTSALVSFTFLDFCTNFDPANAWKGIDET